MNRLVIAIAYRNNPAMLREQQRVIADYPDDVRAKTLLIVCDDASAEGPAHEAAVETNGYEIQVYRILGPEEPWTHLRPRQLGMDRAPAGSWVLATDCDHVLPPVCARQLLEFEPLDGCFYTFVRHLPNGAPTNPHKNSYLLQREWFWDEVGGLNEDLVGIYGSDSVFKARAPMFGKCVLLPSVSLVVYNRGGIDLTEVKGCATNLPRKGGPYHAKSNPELARKMRRAHEVRPERPLRFQWERML